MKNQSVKLSILLLAVLATFLTGCTEKRVLTFEANTPVQIEASEWRSMEITLEESRDLKNPGKIYLAGNYLFVNEIMTGVHIFDNSNPASPEPVGFLPVLANADIAVMGSRLFLDSYFDLLEFDISDINNPVLTNRLEDVFDFWDIARIPGYDVNFPMSQVDYNKIVIGWEVKKVTQESRGSYPIMEDMLFTTDVAMDASSGGSEFAGPGKAGSLARFALKENVLFTLQTSRLGVIDITSAPTHLQDIFLSWTAETLFPKMDRLFIGTQTGMLVYDISNPENPKFLSQFAHVNSCDPVVVDGDIAYVTLSTGSRCPGDENLLQLVDISDITAPSLMHEYEMTNPRGLGTSANLLFICDGWDGLKVYDKTDPASVMDNQISHFPGIVANDVIPTGGTLIMTSEEGIFQYDYSDLENITQISLIPVNN